MTINTLNFTFRQPCSPGFSIGMLLMRCCEYKTRVRKICSYCRAAIMTLFLFGGSLVSMVSLGAQLITVEPQVQYNVSGQDDLKLMRQFFREATWTSPISSRTWNMLKPLGVSKARLMVESRNSVSVDSTTKELHFDFSNLLKALKNCKAYGLIPHIIVGQHPQIALAASIKNGKYYGISDWAAYEEYAYAFLEFVMIKKGFLQADFEVANEPDINGASWLLQASSKYGLVNGDPKMYSAYIKLYGVWAQAADKLVREHPELKLRIGGPAITVWSYGFGKLNWAEQFLKDVVAQQLRLDFISFHLAGNGQSLSGLPEFGKFPSVNKHASYLRGKLKTMGLNNIPMYVTEWHPSYIIIESPGGIINGNHVGAAWMARFLLDMAENNIEEGSLLLFSDLPRPDLTHPGKFTNNWGGPSLLLSDGVTPKALYNVALMFSKLPGQRVNSFPTRQGSIGIIASADASKVGILAFNQNWDFPNAKELATTEEVQIQVNGLPFITPKARVVRYVVDETHSNAYYLYKNKVTPTPQNAALRKVEIKDIPVINGTVNLPNVDLEPSSVTLWEITASK